MMSIDERLSNLRTRIVIAKAWTDAAREASAEARKKAGLHKNEAKLHRTMASKNPGWASAHRDAAGLHDKAAQAYDKAAEHYGAGKNEGGSQWSVLSGKELSTRADTLGTEAKQATWRLPSHPNSNFKRSGA